MNTPPPRTPPRRNLLRGARSPLGCLALLGVITALTTAGAADARRTPWSDKLAPSLPALSVSTATRTSVTVRWTAATDNVAVTGYGFYLGGALVATTTSLSRTMSGLSCGTAYAVGVDAFDGAGNRSGVAAVVASTTPCPDTSAPAAPSGLALTVVNETSVGFSWKASTDNVGVVGYGIYQAGIMVDSVTGTSYVLTGLACGTTQSATVDAVDGVGNRSPVAVIYFTTSACSDTTPPTTPTNVAKTSSSASSITLSWSPATDNTGVAEYGIYVNGTRAATATSTSAVATGLTCGTQYTLGVDAADAKGNRSSKASILAAAAACPPPPPPPPAPSGAANLVVSPSGNDASCARNVPTAPCATFGGAYAKAQSDDLVEVASGSYGDQRLGSRTLGSLPVRFKPAAGASINLAGLAVNTSNVDITGMSIGGGIAVQRDPTTGMRPGFVTLRNMTSKSMFIAADNVTVLGGSYGGFSACDPNTLEDGIQIWLESPSTPPSHVTLDGVTVHDVSDGGNDCAGTAQAGRHVDCLQVLSGTYITVRNSRFYGCATSNITARPYIAPLENITIENNFFASPVRAGNNVYLGGGTCSAVVYRYNSSPNYNVSGDCTDPIAVYGNILKMWGCETGTTYSNNIFVPGSTLCGTNPKQCAPSFANPSTTTADFHLQTSDTCARDAFPTLPSPAADIDGQSRPGGAAPDAGADETG